ncbi:unnamed protein product [Rhizoctonia solani]|uniref:Uncharacterized protein n=1 Tax=Rhizoctonia solani TaxID=456999 RepID=A0A8H3GUJ9_9AGAM|nr:unnamed protein product [Rhizoctonia solani]
MCCRLLLRLDCIKPTPKNAEDKRSQYKPPPHIKNFFAQYPEFDYDPTKHYIDEFYRMTKQFRWNSKGTLEQQAKFRAARENVDRASVHQFNEIYGTDVDDHAAWQKIFEILRMGKAPKRIGACKRRVREYHANLCDLVHNHARGKGTKRFRSAEELRDYTIRTGKFFPQKHADAGGLLRFLLRHLLNPPSNPHTHSVPKPAVKKVQ